MLRLCNGEKRSDEIQQSTDITDIQTQDDISPIGPRRYPDTGITSSHRAKEINNKKITQTERRRTMRYDTIIWDLDGTLLDTLDDLAAATNHALRTWGMRERTRDEVRQFVGNGVRMLITRAVDGGEENPLFDNVFRTFKEYYIDHCQDTTRLYDGIMETLLSLRRMGIRMAVVSNKLQAGVTELNAAWLDGMMDVAVGEREGTRRKPAPDMVEIAMREMGAKRETTVYIGDSDVDIETARNARLDCISVLWGFRDREFLIEHGAKTLVSRPQDIIDIISTQETGTAG